MSTKKQVVLLVFYCFCQVSMLRGMEERNTEQLAGEQIKEAFERLRMSLEQYLCEASCRGLKMSNLHVLSAIFGEGNYSIDWQIPIIEKRFMRFKKLLNGSVEETGLWDFYEEHDELSRIIQNMFLAVKAREEVEEALSDGEWVDLTWEEFVNFAMSHAIR